MTREEAIELLDNLIGMIEDNQNNDYDEALKMGIKALENQPIHLLEEEPHCTYCVHYIQRDVPSIFCENCQCK